MAMVTVVSSIRGEYPAEEFYAVAPDVALAVDRLIREERQVATEDWVSDVIFHTTMYFNAEGFSFTITDNGGAEPITYLYTFTA